jgi:hypothetical protein
VTLPGGDDAAEVGISTMVSDKEHGPVLIRDDLASHNGLKAGFFGRIDKIDEAVKAVRVGEGEPVHALLPGGPADLFHRAHAPSGRVVGMNVKMDKLHISPQRHRGRRKIQIFHLPGGTGK